MENWASGFQMYRRNASLRHILMIIIMSGYTPARYIAIADLERRECAPVSMGPELNRPLTRIWTVIRNFVRIPVEVVFEIYSFRIHESDDLTFCIWVGAFL